MIFCPTVAATFFSLWDEGLSTLCISPVFSVSPNMSQNDLDQPVAAAATTQVKLSPYDEGEPHIWFRLIETQFAMAGIKSQKLKYANALASLPKQVLQDILDTGVDVCNDSDQPFDHLKEVLLEQFGKSEWQSYFDLLLLPMEIQGLKPSILMEKLKYLPPGVIPDMGLFFAMFLIRLLRSMR
jgi:hypothetical protein